MQSNQCFVIYNHVSPAHAAQLHERYADHLGNLFQGGFTTGGTGLGMRICADIIGNAYGLPSVEQCIQGGYVGVALVDAFFCQLVPLAGGGGLGAQDSTPLNIMSNGVKHLIEKQRDVSLRST